MAIEDLVNEFWREALIANLTRAEYSAGLKSATEQGWLELHESGTFVRFTPAGADLFA